MILAAGTLAGCRGTEHTDTLDWLHLVVPRDCGRGNRICIRAVLGGEGMRDGKAQNQAGESRESNKEGAQSKECAVQVL